MTEQPIAGVEGEPDMPEHVAPGDTGHAEHHNLLADDAVWFKSNIEQLHRALGAIADHPSIKALADRIAALETAPATEGDSA